MSVLVIFITSFLVQNENEKCCLLIISMEYIFLNKNVIFVLDMWFNLAFFHQLKGIFVD